MDWTRAVGISLLVTVVCFERLTQAQVQTEGLYLSNGTDILFIRNPQNVHSTDVSVYHKDDGRIVGLTFDMESKLMFWSDIHYTARGIYQGSVNTDGSITSVTTLVSSDIMDVNGLSVDWTSNNLYWTDEGKRTVEVMNFDTKHRRVLFSDQLQIPRGIYVDPVNGYLFWNDQGYERIERSRLDGSGRTVLVEGRAQPNQMVVYNRKLYWVNSKQKTLESYDLSGSSSYEVVVNLETVSSGKNIFGLAIHNNIAYITNWVYNELITVNLAAPDSAKVTALRLGSDVLFSAAYFSSAVQPAPGGTSKCSQLRCSHLCLRISTYSDARCSCPSFGGLILKGSNCEAVTGDILIYALADSGYVGYYSEQASTHNERYLIGRSLRPVGVAYDPVKKMVYWSDVSERTIHRTQLDGKGHGIFMDSDQGLGVIDGMAVDYVHRQLYYTHLGSVDIDGMSYSWHKVETVQLDPPYKVRTLVDLDENPRAIALDLDAGHLYYTDWSQRAKIMRINLDGSQPIELRAGLDNPNGLALIGSGSSKRLYVSESHYKTREHINYPVKEMNGSIYSMKLDGTDWKSALSSPGSFQLVTPFGLAADGSGVMYVSDWSLQTVVSLNVNNGTERKVILSDVTSPMMLLHTPVTVSVSKPNECSSSQCDDVCLTSSARRGDGSSQPVCTCNSYASKVLSGDKKRCKSTEAYITFADLNGLKIQSIEGTDHSVYTIVQGDPYTANIIAVAYDPFDKTTYYSDADSEWIMSVNEYNMTSEFYQVSDDSLVVIDGMTVHDTGRERRLYWSDSLGGRILYVTLLANNSSPDIHTVVVSGLNKPRAVQVYGSFLYWTEWGEGGARVARLDISRTGVTGSDVTALPLPALKWPNGLYLDNNRLYVADGHPMFKKILNCSLDGSRCTEVEDLSKVLQHVYDIFVHKDIIYYTDWRSRALIAYSSTHKANWTLIQGLMRPCQMIINLPKSFDTEDYCAVSNGNCTDICVNLLGTRGCACRPGRVLSKDDQITCIDPVTATCNDTSLSRTPVIYGAVFSPRGEVCTNCQCLAGSTRHNDATYGRSLKCHRVSRAQCPTLTCADNSSTILSEDSCCPVCVRTCNIKITDCPQETIKLSLGKETFAVYDYLPTVKDCLGLQREISLTRRPPTTIYHFTSLGDIQQVEILATVNSGDADKCRLNIIVQDNTFPTIVCPSDISLFTSESHVPVTWTAPAVSDNVGIQDGYPKSSVAWGSNFGPGVTTVTYTVKDKSNQEATCSFKANVTRQSDVQCKMPVLINGRIACTDTTQYQCTIECDSGYTNVQPFNNLTCTGGNWSQSVDFFNIKTCIKHVRHISGSVSVDGQIACQSNPSMSYTETFLEDKIKNRYLWRSNHTLSVNVKTTGCMTLSAKGQGEIQISITLSAIYSNESHQSSIKSDIDRLLQDIAREIERGFLVLVYVDSNGIHTTTGQRTSVMASVDNCPAGSVETQDNLCAVCPVGTHVTKVKDNDECSPCTVGTYNEQESQETCTTCPSGTTSLQGSYINYMCESKPSEPTDFLIYIIIGAGLLILLILIICIVVIFKNCRQKGKSYTVDEGVYDQPMMDMGNGKDTDLDLLYENPKMENAQNEIESQDLYENTKMDNDTKDTKDTKESQGISNNRASRLENTYSVMNTNESLVTSESST